MKFKSINKIDKEKEKDQEQDKELEQEKVICNHC